MKHWMKLVGLWAGIIWNVFSTVSAQTLIKGVVKDGSSGLPIEDVSVYFKGGNGVLTDTGGRFTLTSANLKLITVQFSHVGYLSLTKVVNPGGTQQLDIELNIKDQLHDIVIKGKGKGKYRNKGNPAVELIRKVIEHKDANRVGNYNYLEYQEYEKMECSLTKQPEKLMNSKLFKNFKFMFENQDTTLLPGKSLLPIYLEETAYQRYFRKDPERSKSYILSRREVNYGEYLDMRGIKNYLNRLYMPVDVYDNNIALLSTQFMSPIADLSPTFYLFYIQDTTELDGVKLVRMNFYPRNPDDLLFKGTLWITLDGQYAVQKVDFGVSKYANLNWARDVHIRQTFERGSDQRYHISYSQILAEFSLLKTSSGGIMGERAVTYSHYVSNHPAADSVYQGAVEVVEAPDDARTDSILLSSRGRPLTRVESKVYTNIDSLQNMRSFKRTLDYATLFLAGYKRAGPWFEIGPVSAFYSFNPVEGFRLRFGGRSLPTMSKTFYTETYIAYGFKDSRVKYFLSGTYALNHRTIYDYPFDYIQASFQHDTKIPGQDLQFVQEDNFLLSFKRGDNEQWLYNDIFKLNYVREFGKGLSYNLGFKYWKQVPAGDIVYEKQVPAGSVNIPSVTTGELSADLRWAPNEQFYQGKVYRIPIFNRYPIFEVKYTQGIKGLAGGGYSYSNIWANAYKRFYLAQLGYADVTLEGGYIFGRVPFPLLDIHRANQSYAYQLNAYNLMNFMEFVSDHYGALNIDQNFGGFFFNKIPLLKKLKLREVGSAKILFGGVRDENNPYKTPGLFKFPTYPLTTTPSTYFLGDRPYIEVSAGIGNIFKIIRVDYVRRLTYLSHPFVDQWGIRVRTKFEF
jgi:hypothetical protein